VVFPNFVLPLVPSTCLERIERQPGAEEDDRDGHDHDVCTATTLVVLGVSALKEK
jgi:hypothetical protein